MSTAKLKSQEDGSYLVTVKDAPYGLVFKDDEVEKNQWFWTINPDTDEEESSEDGFKTRKLVVADLLAQYDPPEGVEETPEEEGDGLDGLEELETDGEDDGLDSLEELELESEPEVTPEPAKKKRRTAKPKAEPAPEVVEEEEDFGGSEEEAIEFHEAMPESLEQNYRDMLDEEREAFDSLLDELVELREGGSVSQGTMTRAQFFLCAVYSGGKKGVDYKDLAGAWEALSGEECKARDFKRFARHAGTNVGDLYSGAVLQVVQVNGTVKFGPLKKQDKKITDALKVLKADGTLQVVKEAME